MRVAQESLSYLPFAYVVRSASCYTNRPHISLLSAAPSCYALVAKHFRMRSRCNNNEWSLTSLVSLRNCFIVWRMLHNHYNCTCIALRRVLKSVLQESQRIIYAFVMLLLAMISLHMLTFRLMVTMVADFCSLVILIHNTLMGEITISSTWTTRGNLYSSVRNDTFPHAIFKFIDFMVIELRWFKEKKKKKKMKKTWTKRLFQILCTYYITTQPIFVYWLFLPHS